MVDYLVDHPTNHITMVVPFTAAAAWLWQISKPYPREPLRKGLGKCGLRGFCLVLRCGWEKNISFHNRFFLLFYTPPDSFNTKTMESRFPHAPPLSILLVFLSSVMPACFWLVVAFEISIGSHLRPRHFFFFFAQFAAPNDCMASAPHVPPRSCALSNIPPTANANFWLVVVLSDQKMAT